MENEERDESSPRVILADADSSTDREDERTYPNGYPLVSRSVGDARYQLALFSDIVDSLGYLDVSYQMLRYIFASRNISFKIATPSEVDAFCAYHDVSSLHCKMLVRIDHYTRLLPYLRSLFHSNINPWPLQSDTIFHTFM
jgi:hypothetical protein